nr:GST23 [Paeonia lactiflora]
MSTIWSAFKLPQGLEQEEATVEARENLKSLEQLLKGNKFFGGESIGFLDLALGWLANLISIFEEITGSTMIDEKTFPLLFKWMQDFSEVPVVKESWPPRDQLIVKFRALREPFLATGT